MEKKRAGRSKKMVLSGKASAPGTYSRVYNVKWEILGSIEATLC